METGWRSVARLIRVVIAVMRGHDIRLKRLHKGFRSDPSIMKDNMSRIIRGTEDGFVMVATSLSFAPFLEPLALISSTHT